MSSGRAKPFSPGPHGTAATTDSIAIGPYTWGNSPLSTSADS